MAAPDMSATVDYCKQGVVITEEERREGCGDYSENLLTSISRRINTFRG